MAHPESDRELVERDDRRIASTLFQAADVLLAESRDVSKLLLRQTLFLSDSFDVLSNQLAHVHAQWSADYTLTIVCTRTTGLIAKRRQ
jgi:hypothetical protein